MAWARLAVVMLAAVAGAILVLVTPLDQLERAVWTLGVRNLLPQLNPPLGETARFALAGVAALLGGLIGWGVLALLGVGGRGAPEEAAEVPAPPAWRLPPSQARAAAAPEVAAAPRAAAGPDARPVFARANAPAPASAPDAPATAAPATAAPATPGTVAAGVAAPAMVAPAAPGPVAARGAAAVADAVPAPSAAPVAPVGSAAPVDPAAPVGTAPAVAAPLDDAARTAMLASLARIEAQLAEARQGPVVGPNAQLIARFEELDSRVTAQVTQIAQQLVEVAQLARSAARAPAPAPAPAALLPVAAALEASRPLPVRPGRRPANRAELAAAIRSLRATLDAGPGLGGAA